ncbi:MAG: HlyD family secretion protein, partial [Clostridiales bacterium]|nr:HlyD family secretion protein [Clostridiales bacterium]
AVNKNDVIAVIYPSGNIVVKGYVSEFEVRSLHVGDEVEVEILSTHDETKTYSGRIISIAQSSSKENKEMQDGSVTFGVTVEFDTDEILYYGMSVIVNVVN